MLRPRISPTSATRISAVRRGLRHLQRCPPLGVADAGLRSVNAPPSQQLLQQQHERDPQHAADLPILEQHLQEQLQQLGAHQVQTAHQAPLHLTQQQLSQQQHQAPVQHTLNGTTISSSISNAIAAPEIAAAAATQPTSTITNTSTTSTNSTSTTTSASTSTSTSTSSNQAEAHAKRLFDFNPSHIPAWSPLLALYFPIGVVVAALRMLLWIGGVLIDAPWFRSQAVVRTYLSLLGFKATWRNTELLPKGRHVMVSNHITPGDLMVLFEVGCGLCGNWQHFRLHKSGTGSSQRIAESCYLHLLYHRACPSATHGLTITPGLPWRSALSPTCYPSPARPASALHAPHHNGHAPPRGDNQAPAMHAALRYARGH